MPLLFAEQPGAPHHGGPTPRATLDARGHHHVETQGAATALSQMLPSITRIATAAGGTIMPFRFLTWLLLCCLSVGQTIVTGGHRFFNHVVGPGKLGQALEAIMACSYFDSSPCSASVARARLRVRS